MRVTVAKVHDNLFDGDATSLTAPTTSGQVTILPHHEPFVGTLKEGTVTVRTGAGNHEFVVTSGIVEVSNDHATVLL